MSEEAELIDQSLVGNADAFGQLVRQHEDRLFAAMCEATRSPEEAEDAVQEAFVRAYLKLDTFHRNSRFFTWLYRIAFNCFLNERRRKRPSESLDQTRETLGSEPTGDIDAPDERMLQDERVELVRRALDCLSAEHRAILVLREMEDLPYEEIAEILDVAVGTVRSRLSRARTQLRSTLDAMEHEG